MTNTIINMVKSVILFSILVNCCCGYNKLYLSNAEFNDLECITEFEYSNSSGKQSLSTKPEFENNQILFAYNNTWESDYITVSTYEFDFEICLIKSYLIDICVFWLFPYDDDSMDENNYEFSYKLDGDTEFNSATMTTAQGTCQGTYGDCTQVIWTPEKKNLTKYIYFKGSNLDDATNRRFVDVQCFYDHTLAPTLSPSNKPTEVPSPGPTNIPSDNPTPAPTGIPTPGPTNSPVNNPTSAPSGSPTPDPTNSPVNNPTGAPSIYPTDSPTDGPTPVCATCCPTTTTATPITTTFSEINGTADTNADAVVNCNDSKTDKMWLIGVIIALAVLVLGMGVCMIVMGRKIKHGDYESM